MAPVSLPPGFRFHPTDEELVAYYLDRKINGGTIELEIIPDVDLYKFEPWDLPEKSFLPSKDMEWYFFSPRDRKYPNGSRTNRATRTGYWKATGKDRIVRSQKLPVGMKKTLVYYRGRAPHGIRSDWVMHEYRLIDSECDAMPSLKDSYALCRIFKKNAPNLEAKHGDQLKEEPHWGPEDYLVGDSSIREDHFLQQGEADDEELYERDSSKFPSAASSDVTQGTPFDNGVADEANSATNSILKDPKLPNFTSWQHQLSYPPLVLEDFPEMDTIETRFSEPQTFEDYIMHDKDRGFTNEPNILDDFYNVGASSSQDQHFYYSNYPRTFDQ